MAEKQILQIPRFDDKSIIKCFRTIATKYDFAAVNINALGAGGLGSVDIRDDAEENTTISTIEKQNNTLLVSMSMSLLGFNIIFYRGGQVEPKSPYYDEIHFTFQPNPQFNVINRLEISAFIAKELQAYTPGRVVGKLSKEQKQLEAIHTSTLDRLESINEDLIKTTHQYRDELDTKFNAKTEELENSFNLKETKLDAEYIKKQEAINTEVEALEVKQKELDDRNNTHARREIRRDILKEIKERQKEFNLTKGTNKLRTPIHITMWSLIGFFIIMSISTAFEIHIFFSSGSEKDFILLSVKQFLYSIGSVGSFIFYIKWLNRWFEQHSSTEFQLKKFELDMERASWLVETNLEWNDKKDNVMPSDLLKSLSNNLFDNDKIEHDPLVHPADQLASALMGSASAVKLKAGDSSIEIDPKKLAKQK